VSRAGRGAIFPLLLAWQRREASLEGEHLSDWFEHVAHIQCVASGAGQGYTSLFARRRNALVRAPGVEGKGIPRVCFRSCEPSALSPAADLADVSRWRLEDVGGQRSTFRRSST